MAASDAKPFPIKNTAYRVTFPILDADGDLVTGATGLDSEISKDAGTFTDCTNEATEIATSSGIYYLDLSSTEMNADCVAIIVKTSSSGAKTTTLVMYPVEAGDIDVDVTSWNGTAVATPDTAGYPKVTIKSGTGTGEISLTSGIARVDVDTIKTNPVVNGGTITFPSGATLASTTNITAGTITTATNLTNAPTAGDLTATMKASVNTEVDAAIETYHLDHLLAADYDPASKPGVSTALLNELIGSDAGVSQFTANALELAPTGGSAPTVGQIADAVWDEAQADHVTAGSFGITASEIADILVDTAEIGAAGAGLTAVRANILRTGTAQAGASGTITLDSGASAVDSFYKHTIVRIVSGTGAGQSRLITAYVGSTKVATIESGHAWDTTPDNTSVFDIIAFSSVDLQSWAGTAVSNSIISGGSTLPLVNAFIYGIKTTSTVGVLNNLLADYDGTGYAGGTIPKIANATQISGDATAADNAEAFFDGTGYAGTNNVIPTVTTLTGNTPQTGDSFARIGATGSGLTSLAPSTLLSAALTESYRGTNATGSATQLLYEIMAHLGEFAIVSTTKTTKKVDGSTTAKTYTLDSATTPTSITEAT